ncbi:Hint domain-containing protein [Pseudosulfitobacter pseudonitzschiae]|uniref:Hint domain-containing protein n=1 Tax=Pseudosulfitobacter pseudonitzschiae TaxID=1402135 RepID=UPI001AF19337|nr:Hint domain-containing protein [Pseudosulfitobacter pseudonitzschiae]MBM1813969.1 Hint domain-containing protein [Pseudosulfitobacter pseudonitzschiae]MBM1830962.1 Hint domain-containing protein [Pseudosulfitobacter pseudonitzschiae]MBM1835829.1 Hint domain-containing protein [Pseudosulfitobacter pseudonitzschiae]MBM1840675.1 Hint domain-containing protein [Pseudosulfitobacter pseudonitzschiae]MBM1845337.1 Hint domain-containing protein [Pseudosulfitobacter pseudonitzschiae]
MATFATTHAVTYSLSNVQPVSVQNSTEVVTDGEADTTFETGDSYTSPTNGQMNYIGTMLIDGVTWPVFSYDAFPDFVSVFMTQEPVSVPATPAVNSGDTYAVPCFAKDTMIATSAGEVAVQDLKIGDCLITADGAETRVKWVGHRTIMPMFGLAKRNEPVKIAAGSLGDNVPTRDLVVTADHGMILNDLIINASALVNGSSIRFVKPAELDTHFTVYHIETTAHDAIVANGAASETFVDYVTRQSFDNYQEYLDLYGDERPITEMDRPRVSAARLLPPAIRAWLDARQVA